MEITKEILDTLDIGNVKDVMEALIQGAVKQEIRVFKSEATEETAETEIEEIIEIIEEVVEIEVEESQECVEDGNVQIEKNDNHDDSSQSEQFEKNASTEMYAFDEEHTTFKSQQGRALRSTNEGRKSSNKQVVAYDADEDWEDDEMESMVVKEEEELDQSSDFGSERAESLSGNKKSVNNQIISLPLQSSRLEARNNLETIARTNVNNAENVDTNTGHEIVKNVENNLLYTVLGSKKQAPTSKSGQAEKLTDAHYIKMEQLHENTIPVEGTIYYEGDDMETLYVAQAVDGNEQYENQYENQPMEQEEQAWEGTNSDNAHTAEEEASQDQIFLHEDEDGQLYFKDESGTLQPVYLTEDGNYAIADNSDDQDSKESTGKFQLNARPSDGISFSTPDLEIKSAQPYKQGGTTASSSSHDIDNEDNTVTISLIISEDEHGQKRTQVIIPTTDTLKCDICNKSFKTSFQLLRHNRLKHAREEDITTRNFPCDLCPKRYPDQNSLARHRKTHTGDRPFQCLECHKNFPTSTALRRHLTLHNSQSRPLPCIYCGRRFVEKASLAKHERSHLPGDQQTHTCDVCQKTFLHATDLSLHKKYHDPDKKFDCEVCGREFNRLNNLQRHMMVHQQQGANEEILSCDVCGITYKFMSSLTRHMVTTHMNPEKLRQQAEEQRRKRENNYRRYLENRKIDSIRTTFLLLRSDFSVVNVFVIKMRMPMTPRCNHTDKIRC